MRLFEYFDRGLSLNPEGPCLIAGGDVHTYNSIAENSHKVANALIAAGIGNGGHAAVYSPNVPRVMECILGTLRAGAIWLPINARNAVDENIYILNNIDCDWLFYHSAFEEQVARVRAEVPNLKGTVCLDGPGQEAPSFDDWTAGQDGPAPALPPDPGGVAAILSSGGTTGKPKGVVTTHQGWELMIANFITSMPFNEPPVQLVAAPLSHGAGAMCFPILAAGGVNVIMMQPDPLAIMEHIQEYRITRLYLPPTLIYMMLAHPRVREFDYSSLRHFLYAGAPMSVEKLKEAMEVFGPVMCQSFGQAETLTNLTYFSAEEHIEAIKSGNERRLWSCGQPCLTNRVEIMDDAGNLLGADENGEIVVQGGMVMKEYYRNAQATAEARAHGWHHTGDIGCKDEDGFIYIVDRKKDMIITGGFNVYPSEIEQLVMTFPEVQDCAVIGVPDEKWGEAVKAILQLKPGAELAESHVIALCKGKLGSVKTPKSVEFWDDLPRSPVGKVMKREIRKKFWTGQNRQIS